MKGSKRERRPGVWELRVHAGTDPITGRPRYVSKTVHGGSRAADRELAMLVAGVGVPRASKARIEFSALLDRWLEHLESIGRSPTTIRGYRSKIETAIRPALGNVRLDALKPEHLDRFYAARVKNGDAPRSVIAMHRIMHTALGQAVRWGWMESNPASRATAPSAGLGEIAVPSPSELREIVDRARSGKYPERADLLMFLALTGMRRGELCGLRWTDIDFPSGMLTVRRAVLDVGKLVERQPKSGRIRRLSLGELGAEILTERRQLAERRCNYVGAAFSPNGYVWSDSEDGLGPMRPGTLTQYFARIVVQCGYKNQVGGRFVPRFSLHSLRHFAATQMIGANVDVRTVSGRTGHADAATLLRIYAHALHQRDREAANILGTIIGDRIVAK